MFNFSGLLTDKKKKKVENPIKPVPLPGTRYDKRGDPFRPELTPDDNRPEPMLMKDGGQGQGRGISPLKFDPLGTISDQAPTMSGGKSRLDPRVNYDMAQYGNTQTNEAGGLSTSGAVRLNPIGTGSPIDPTTMSQFSKTRESDINETPTLAPMTAREKAQIYANTMADPNHPDNKMSPWRAGLSRGLTRMSEVLLSGGDWGQAIGTGISQGGQAALNPKMLADERHQQQIAALQPQIEAEDDQVRQRDAQIKSAIEREQQITNLGKSQTEAQQAKLSLVRALNKPLYDSVTADNQITPEEAQQLKSAGYGDVVPYDQRQFDTRYESGVPFASPSKGAPNFTPIASLPIDKTKTPVNYKSPSGQTFTLTQSQAAQFEQSILQGDATRSLQVLIANTRIENEGIEAKDKATNQRESLLAERDNYLSIYQTAVGLADRGKQELAALQSSGTADASTISQKQTEIANAEKSAAQAMAKSQELGTKYQTFKTPTDPKKIPAPVQLGAKLSEKNLRAKAKQKGLTPEQTEAAIADAKAKGLLR